MAVTSPRRLTTPSSVNAAIKQIAHAPEELLNIIEARGREIDTAIADLRASLAKGD